MSTDLEVRRVILYRAGVGWFELEGDITGDSTRLFFKEKDMNDLLKTLNIELLGDTESRIRAISFDSALPPEKLKESLSITVSPVDSIRNLIQELVGRRVEMGLESGNTVGTVIGEQTIRGTEGSEQIYIVFRDLNGAINFLDLKHIRSLTLEDKNLQADLGRALDVEAASKRKETKPISIYFTDAGDKTLRFSYLAETPAWKTSYRLYHHSEDNKTTLQGWAIVDNTQQQNWDNVYLTLVTGLPITFIYDLFSPQHIQRPYVQREEVTSLRPDEIEDGFAPPEAEFDDMAMDKMFEMGAGGMPPSPAPAAKARRARARDESLSVAAETKEVGGTYVAYEIATPVTIKQNQTALVPLIQDPLEARKIRIYNPTSHATHPLMALQLKNTTGKVIDKGPFTVILDDVYAGEGILPMFHPNDERIVTFSLEQAVSISKDVHEERHWLGLDFLKKYMKKRFEALREITYKITNKRDEVVTLLIDEPKIHGFKPFGEIDAIETDKFYRYEFPIGPNVTETYHISFKRVYYERLEKRNIYQKDIDQLLKDQFITNKQASQLSDIVQLRTQSNKLKQDREAIVAALQRMESEQARLRENLKALGDSIEEAKLRQRYVDKLSQQEESIEQWQQQVKTLDHDIKKAVQQLESFLQAL